MTQPLSLSRPEIGALLELTGDVPSSIPQGERVKGVALLIARGLATIRGDDVHLVPELVDGLHALAEPEGSLLLALGETRSGKGAVEFFVAKSMVVAAYYSADASQPLDTLDIIALADAGAAIVKALVAHGSVATPDTSAGEAEASSVFGTGPDTLPPPVRSAAQMSWKPRDGEERIASVLLHDRGFSWIEGRDGQNARLAYVETEEELAELVAGLIGVGVK